MNIEHVASVDSSALDIATAGNNGLNGPIYVSQYTNISYVSNTRRRLTLLDQNGNTTIPGQLTVNSNVNCTNVNSSGNLFVKNTNIFEFIFPLGSFKMLYHHPG